MRKAALITGGAKRVGRGLSLYLAQQGYDIALHYHTSQHEAGALQREIQALGRMCELFPCDLMELEALPGLIQRVAREMPHCSVLINSASRFEPGPFLETTPQHAQEMHRINCESPAFLTQAFAKEFGRGHVVNILDTAITQNRHSYFFYLLAKKALAEFTRMAALELAPAIRVNAVCPGVMLPSGPEWDEAYMERHAKEMPLGRIATVDELCRHVGWLLESEAVTGQLVFIDGGEHLL